MRTITSTLLDAQQSRKPKPYLAAAINNRRLRYTQIANDTTSQFWTSMLNGGTFNAIYRLRTNGSGNCQMAIITTPTTAAQWTTWTNVATTALAGSDNALCLTPTNDLRIFWVQAGAASTYEIWWKEWASGGSAWSAAAALVTGLTNQPWLAADDLFLFYTTLTTIVAKKCDDGSTTWSTTATFTTPDSSNTGIGASLDTPNNPKLMRMTFCCATLLYTITYSTFTDTFDAAAVQIAPGGVATASTYNSLHACEILCTATDGYFLSYLDHYDGSPTIWAETVVLRSSDFIHWGSAVGPNITHQVSRPAPMCEYAGYLYVGNEQCIVRSLLPTPSLTSSQTYTSEQITFYHRHTQEGRSTVILDLANDRGQFDEPAVIGEVLECAQSFAELVVSRGCTTSAGDESCALDPHYITSATVRDEPDLHVLRIEAVDGWGLLDMWRPAESQYWHDKHISWLIAEMLGKVGLLLDPTYDAIFDEHVHDFTLLPTLTAADGLKALLRLAGGVLRWQSDGKAQIFPLLNLDTGHLNVGDKTEIRAAEYGIRPYPHTSFKLFGSAAFAYSPLWDAEHVQGQRFSANLTDYRADSATLATAMMGGLYTRAAMATRHHVVTAHLRAEAELWDTVHVTPPRATLIPAGDVNCRLVGIEEDYTPRMAQFLSHLTLGQL